MVDIVLCCFVQSQSRKDGIGSGTGSSPRTHMYRSSTHDKENSLLSSPLSRSRRGATDNDNDRDDPDDDCVDDDDDDGGGGGGGGDDDDDDEDTRSQQNSLRRMWTGIGDVVAKITSPNCTYVGSDSNNDHDQ